MPPSVSLKSSIVRKTAWVLIVDGQMTKYYIDGLVEDCSIYSVLAIEVSARMRDYIWLLYADFISQLYLVPKSNCRFI